VINFAFPSDLFSKKVFLLAFLLAIVPIENFKSQTDWLEKDSENFKLIFRSSHAHLADHILISAEKSLKALSELFEYKPSEKIIINTYDVYDYGFATATSVPENFIRLEIEPFEPGYENIPYHERFQWLLNHELVHIVINDQATKFEKFFRNIFSKVSPEQSQPVSIIFSLLTNHSRFTPQWHQEAIAVFWETWLSGGYGRILGNFDEMYFRTLVADSIEFPDPLEIDAILSHRSIFLQKLFYTFGARFAAYLAINYGYEKVNEWFIVGNDNFYVNFENKFEDVFGLEISDAWNNFIKNEVSFQNSNLQKLNRYPLTQIKRLSKEAFGWVTQPYYDRKSNSIIFGYHKSNHLAAIQKFSLENHSSEDIATLPTPSMHQVASTAYLENDNLLFYTTNNNQLYRDIWSLDINSNTLELLFENYRIGDITIAKETKELWGIQHSGGAANLVYSKYPYKNIENLITFDVGQEIFQLSVSQSGNEILAIVHLSDGSQKLIISNCSTIREKRKFEFETLYTFGSPENPSWSSDGKTIFWNAYTNGVSNIYRKELKSNKIEPITHTLRGLFKPIFLNEDSLFAFEYTNEGFIPVIVKNKPANHLPAIDYLGQQVIEKNRDIVNWVIPKTFQDSVLISKAPIEPYSGFANIGVMSFIPIISGFQNQIVLGFYSRLNDPVFEHDFEFEIGISPFHDGNLIPRFHARAKYDYKKRFEINIRHNAPDFYDLFNKRKRGMIGTKLSAAYTHYWLYDNPHKIKQQSEIAYYNGVEFINDNLVRVSEPDFMVVQTIFNSKNLRRSIGSSDYESGNEFNLTLRGFGQDPKNPEVSGQIYAEWDRYSIWIAPHNVFHMQLAGGYHHDNERLIQSRFYFGGFGNRIVDNIKVKQFRQVLRFPGIDMYSLDATRFGKILIENNFPPIRFGSASFLGQHFLNHIDISAYSQYLLVEPKIKNIWIDLGCQINFIFKHWFNLESTLSAGIAKAWHKNENFLEWFISYKILKN
jgi:hypothetical protein